MDAVTNNEPIIFTRQATVVKETKGTFKFDEVVEKDAPVFRSLYIEKWTQVRFAKKVKVTIEFLKD